MADDPRWLIELRRIGALRSLLGSVRTALMAVSGALIVTVVVDLWPVRFVAALIGAYFASSALGMLSVVIEKMDRDQ